MIDLLKTLSKHTLIFSISGIASKAVGFLLLPVYTRYLRPADYGILELLNITMQISIILISQGVPSAFFRSYSYTFLAKKTGRKQSVATSYFYILIVSAVFNFGLFITANDVSYIIFGDNKYAHLIRLISFTVFFQTMCNIPNALLRARLKSIHIAFAYLANLVLNIGLNIYFVVGLGLGINGVVYGNLISAALLASTMLCLIAKDLSLSFSPAILKAMLSFGLPLIPGGLALLVLNGSDRFFLRYFTTTHEIGLYALGYKISSVILVVLIQPFLLIWPSVYYPVGKQADAKEILANLTSLYTLVSLFICLGLILLSKPLIMISTPQNYWGSATICKWLTTAIVLFGFHHILSVGIKLEGKTKLLPIIIITSSLVNIVLNYFLIPIYGISGAAASTFLSFFFMAILTYYMNQRVYPLEYQWGRMLKIILTFLTALIIWGFFPTENIVSEVLKAAFLMLFFLFGVFVTGFFSQREKAKIVEFARNVSLTCLVRNLRRK